MRWREVVSGEKGCENDQRFLEKGGCEGEKGFFKGK